MSLSSKVTSDNSNPSISIFLQQFQEFIDMLLRRLRAANSKEFWDRGSFWFSILHEFFKALRADPRFLSPLVAAWEECRAMATKRLS